MRVASAPDILSQRKYILEKQILKIQKTNIRTHRYSRPSIAMSGLHNQEIRLKWKSTSSSDLHRWNEQQLIYNEFSGATTVSHACYVATKIESQGKTAIVFFVCRFTSVSFLQNRQVRNVNAIFQIALLAKSTTMSFIDNAWSNRNKKP